MAGGINWMTPSQEAGKQDWSWLKDLPSDYAAGAKWKDDQDVKKTFAAGLPKDANGNIDWDKSVEAIGKDNAELAYKFLASGPNSGSAGQYGIGQPIITQDDTGAYHAWAPGRSGTPTELNFGGQKVTVPSHFINGPYGTQETPGRSSWGGESPQPLDEPADTFGTNLGIDAQGQPRVPIEPQPLPEEPTPPEFNEFTGGGGGGPAQPMVPGAQPYKLGPTDAGYDPGMAEVPPPPEMVAQGNAAPPQQMAQNAPQQPQTRPVTTVNPGQVEQEKKQGEIRAITVQDMPAVKNTVIGMIRGLEQIENDKDLGNVTGFFQGRQPKWSQSTDQARVQSYLDQVVGKQFLQAYQGLKGAGAITENEGAAATRAITRLTSQNMNEKDFKQAITDAKYEMFELYNVARAKVGIAPFKNPFAKPGQQFKRSRGEPTGPVIDAKDYFPEWYGM